MLRALRRDGESGTAALELIILAPALIFLLGLVIALGRVTAAQIAVDDAAHDAARQASLQLDPADAEAAGQQSALAALAQDGLNCTPTITWDTSQFGNPVGEPAVVFATLKCDVSLASLVVPGLPGSHELTGKASSPLDPYRQR